MPGDAVVVNVVEDRKARFGGAVDVELGVVRLSLFLVTGLRPRVVSPTGWRLVRGEDLLPVRRPEPAEDVLGFQIGTAFASLEVAQPSGGPDVGNVV